MRTTLKTSTGGELIIEPSPTRGYVWLIHAHPQLPRTIIPIPLHLAGMVAEAVEGTATIMEEACLQPELEALTDAEGRFP